MGNEFPGKSNSRPRLTEADNASKGNIWLAVPGNTNPTLSKGSVSNDSQMGPTITSTQTGAFTTRMPLYQRPPRVSAALSI
jgi:hypothetical protein